MKARLRTWFIRRLWVCEAYGCGLRTRDFYRASMHTTLTQHRPRQEQLTIDWLRIGYALAVIAGGVLALWAR